MCHLGPSIKASRVFTKSGQRLSAHVAGGDVGRVMIFPSDVWRAVRGRNRVQPEVFVVKRVDGKHAS